MVPAGGWPADGKNYTDRPTGDIQRLLIKDGFLPEGSDDEDYGQQTSKAVASWQFTRYLEADGSWGNASDGTGFPPAGSLPGIDYSFARPGGDLIDKRGMYFAGRYLWAKRYPNSKGITRAEFDDLAAHDVETFFIYEEDGKELAGGFAAGVRVATLAQAELDFLGADVKDRPVYFNVDYDANASAMPQILEALKGIASVIGLSRTGLYAGLGPIKAAFDAGLITFGFQTYAWSGGVWDSRAHLQQWANGQWGDTVDFTRAIKANYGQGA